MLMKSLFGLSHTFLYQRLKWISDPILAYRIPTILMASLAVYLTFLLAVYLSGIWAGVGAALALLSMPRLFFHAHIACFDLPVTFMWLVIAMTYLKALKSRWWIVGTGVALGLGFATKLNTFFVPFTLLFVSLLHLLHLNSSQRAGWMRRYGWIALSMLCVGGGVFWLHWPWLYTHTIERVQEYIQFHAHHVHYPVDYLGNLLYRPPFPVHFPFVFTLYTLPMATLLLSLTGIGAVTLGAIQRWRSIALTQKEADQTSSELSELNSYPIELFLLINMLTPLLIIAWPTTPIFGGTKHWMPAMPFLAILAGVGFTHLLRSLSRSLTHPLSQRFYLPMIISISLFCPGIWLTHEYGSHGPAWYNSIAGGVPGGAEKRMPRNFWGYSSREVLPTLRQITPKNAQVFWHNATGIAIHHYRRAGWLREDIQSTGDWTYPYSEWGIYHDQREKRAEELDLWWSYGTRFPVDGYFIDGVQQIGVYQRP